MKDHYCGFTKQEKGKQLMKCPIHKEITLTQDHLVQCSHFQKCFINDQLLQILTGKYDIVLLAKDRNICSIIKQLEIHVRENINSLLGVTKPSAETNNNPNFQIKNKNFIMEQFKDGIKQVHRTIYNNPHIMQELQISLSKQRKKDKVQEKE